MSKPGREAGSWQFAEFAEPQNKEDWRTYVYSTPRPAPELPAWDDYVQKDRLSRRALERRRLSYHSELVLVETPTMVDLHRRMRRTLIVNSAAPAGARRGHVVDGGPTLGKSTIIRTFGRSHELELRREEPSLFEVPNRDFTPVVYISVPTAATPKNLSLKFANYLAMPVRQRASNMEVTDAVLDALRECGTQLVLIDDIHLLDCSQKDGKYANDHLKYLANYCAATFIYAGVEVADSGLFAEGSSKRKTQTSGRFSVLPVEPFATNLLQQPGRLTNADEALRVGQRDEWVSLIWSLESALRLYKHQPGSLVNDWEYLLDRTGGVIATLSALIRGAAVDVILDGTESITRAALDDVEADKAADAEHKSRPRRRTPRAKKTPSPAARPTSGPSKKVS